MKLLALSFLLVFSVSVMGQTSEMLVPREAISVVSINNISLLQKISLDELVTYEFMEELQSELFDGSTSGKSIKDSGIDFDQRLNIFVGNGQDFEVAGFTFGITDKNKLFEVFDDFESIPSNFKGVELYASYFNRLAIKGNNGILLRVSPASELVDEVTDSIWYARGNDYPWDYGYDELYESLDEDEFEETIEFMEEMETEENTNAPVEIEEYPEASQDPTQKTYWELRDSVEMTLQTEYMHKVSEELFIKNINLMNTDEDFANQLTHETDAIFYLDNSRYFMQSNDIWYFQAMYPQLYLDIQELYENNVILGDIVIKDNSIEMDLTSFYGDELGSIYEAMNNARFDKNVLKYIHKENSAFFTYNVDLREAYEQTLDIIIPILEREPSSKVSANLLVIELLDEFMNKDAVFDTYKGSMFGTYNGIQRIKVKKIVFDWDEETFDYIEREEEAEEEIPVFVLGYSTDRSDIPEKIMKRLDRLSNDISNKGDYWEIRNAVLNSAPAYIIIKNDLFIVTNDEDLAKNHADGFGKEAISKKQMKKAMKGGAVYGYADLGKAIENLPREFFDDRENEMLDVIRGKSGHVELTSTGADDNESSFNLVYNFEGSYDNSGTYILDLINSIYVFTR